eukprot:COSAG05_NODE_21136_length_274_cov_0.594286_1_plen_33_part_10
MALANSRGTKVGYAERLTRALRYDQRRHFLTLT